MTSKDPFLRFRAHWFDASFLDGEPAASPVWDNSHGIRARDIEWLLFLSDIPLEEELWEGIAIELAERDPPLMVVLPQLLKAVVEHVRRSNTGPSFKVIGNQLERLRRAATTLADLGQGGNGRGTPAAEPEWWRHDEDDLYRKYIESGQREESGWSPFLHPVLQTHLSRVLTPGVYPTIEANDPAADEKPREARKSLAEFFRLLHLTIPIISKAVEDTRRLEAGVKHLVGPGNPADVARNWALVRLMWIWRDVLDGDPTIYLRRISERIELEEPEPQGCMAFVVANLARIDPVAPDGLPALERHLQTLTGKIPTESLLRERS